MVGRSACEQSPLQSELRCDIAKIVKIDRLDNVRGCSQAAAFDEITMRLRAGQNDDGNLASTRLALDPPQNLQAAHLWKLQIRKDQVGLHSPTLAFAGAQEISQGLASVSNDVHPVGEAGLLKCV